ncbi:hypothetical protein [Nannocystis pusilla]|uniref:hypothetical protein n=1 Tax=Nannocystis pusilla TaxID=889268 RepID=UPI003B79020C
MTRRLGDLLDGNERDCLVNPGAVEATVLAEVDEGVRRWEIYSLLDACRDMCFYSRVKPALKLVIAGSSYVQARAAVDLLRLNPAIGEWRVALGVPTGGDWTMWSTTSSFDSIEVHVTISADSIQLPANAPASYPDGQALRNALFGLRAPIGSRRFTAP